jgi:PAS domain S-box-containing protein
MPGKNTFDFRFTALSLSAPERVRFKYRLEPFDKDWVDGGSQRTAHYTNMAPGEYSFRVIAANSYGVWNEQGDSVRFVLRPHFYQTRWFYLFAATGIVLCAAGAYRLRIRQLQAREAHLAQLVDSRTMELHAEIKVRKEAESGLRQARAELEDRVHERTAQLHESEQRFRTFVDHAADALFVLNFEQGTIFDVNREACRSLGYTREELIGGSSTAFDVVVDGAAHNSIAERAAAGESVVDVHRHRRKDGSVFSVEVHTSLVWYGGQRFLLKIARDITDRLHAEQERERLRQLEADLAHINRVSMMGELAASVAHEVNQPLTGIVSNGSACIRLLAGHSPNVEEALEALRDIVRDGKRAGEVIARIRALTKRAAMPKAHLDLNETIREVLLLVVDEAKKNGIVVLTRLAHNLSPVFGDRVQLQQVFLNLFMNAMEAMSSVDARARQLVITTRNLEPGLVQVTVEDSGTGLDPNTMARIFDPFYTTKSDGMGMGLSISRSIVENHGGRLWATPNGGPGTSFHFSLPKHHAQGSHVGIAEA